MLNKHCIYILRLPGPPFPLCFVQEAYAAVRMGLDGFFLLLDSVFCVVWDRGYQIHINVIYSPAKQLDGQMAIIRYPGSQARERRGRGFRQWAWNDNILD